MTSSPSPKYIPEARVQLRRPYVDMGRNQRETLEETKPDDTLTLNFQPLELSENKFPFFKPLVCGILLL
jgi:hypothetical protein